VPPTNANTIADRERNALQLQGDELCGKVYLAHEAGDDLRDLKGPPLGAHLPPEMRGHT
jgi:hypothetical protein